MELRFGSSNLYRRYSGLEVESSCLQVRAFGFKRFRPRRASGGS